MGVASTVTHGMHSHTVDAGTDLSAATAADLRARVAAVSTPATTITLCLDEVVTFDMAGLGLLLGLHRRVRSADGHLVFARPTPGLLSAIRRIGLHGVLDIDTQPASNRATTGRTDIPIGDGQVGPATGATTLPVPPQPRRGIGGVTR